MTIVATPVPPAHVCHTCGRALLGWPPPAAPARQEVGIDPSATTVALVDRLPVPEGTANVAASLARLARTDELTVVYGSDEDASDPAGPPLVAELRELLPRYTVVAVWVTPRQGLGREAALVEDLLADGGVPVLVTPSTNAPEVAAAIYGYVRADRAVRVAYRPIGEADLQPLAA